MFFAHRNGGDKLLRGGASNVFNRAIHVAFAIRRVLNAAHAQRKHIQPNGVEAGIAVPQVQTILNIGQTAGKLPHGGQIRSVVVLRKAMRAALRSHFQAGEIGCGNFNNKVLRGGHGFAFTRTVLIRAGNGHIPFTCIKAINNAPYGGNV